MNTNIYDTNYLGELDSNGNVKIVYNKEAISNAMILWLTTFPGEYLNRPDEGGILYYYLTQPMSEDNVQNMRNAIIEALNNDFEPAIELLGLTVKPFFDKNKYLIKMKVTSIDIDDEIYLEFPLNSLS